MLNLQRIARLAEAQEHEKLLIEVLRNGRPLPLSVRLRLSEPGSLPASAISMALQRIIQLTYRPTPLSVLLLRMLLAQQRQDGAFGSIASTGVALAALFAAMDQAAAIPAGTRGPFTDPLREQTRCAIDGALQSLRAAQDAGNGQEGPCDALPLIGDELDTAIILWQLALEPRFASAVRYEELLAAVESRGVRHNRAARPLLERIGGAQEENAPHFVSGRSAA